MNERIQKLIEQATRRGEEYLPGNDGHPTPTVYFDKEKFAQLIVLECADVIAPMGDWCGGHGEPSMPSTMECAKRLKQHFGVEE